MDYDIQKILDEIQDDPTMKDYRDMLVCVQNLKNWAMLMYVDPDNKKHCLDFIRCNNIEIGRFIDRELNKRVEA